MMGSGPYYGLTKKGLDRWLYLDELNDKDALSSPRLAYQYYILDLIMDRGAHRSIALTNPELLMQEYGGRIDPKSRQWLREFRRLVEEGYITEDSPYTKDGRIGEEDLEFYYYRYEGPDYIPGSHEYPKFNPPGEWNKEFWN